MKTPYDAALRTLQREVDDLRTSIGTAANRLTEIESMRQAVSDAIRSESALAATDLSISPHAYLARARTERARLVYERLAADARLEALRHQAMESYGSLRAMEGAAETYREQAERDLASAEQGRIDDFAGARFARALQTARQGMIRS